MIPIMTKGDTFLITGGAGSLGKRLTHRLIQLGSVEQVVIYSRDEGKHADMRSRFADEPNRYKIHYIIGDVRDAAKFDEVIRHYKPDVVIHAAALKRIDDAEANPDECCKTNINGSTIVAETCMRWEVPTTILVSTDKACDPVNVYGSSKFIAERIFTHTDARVLKYGTDRPKLYSVRYGNVIASRGSFVPIWNEAIQSNKTISITSLEMTRFLFTLDDAVTFILSTIPLARGGEVFVPNISSFKIWDVFQALQRMHGRTEHEHSISGLRSGEKMHESMISSTEIERCVVAADNIVAIEPWHWLQFKSSTLSSNPLPSEYNGVYSSSNNIVTDIEYIEDIIKRGLEVSG